MIPVLDHQLQTRLESKLKVLNHHRPLPPAQVAKIREHFSLEMTYNSNAIEGNSLTLKETAWVIKDGLTIKGKPLKDHLEARDHHAALEFLYDLIDKKSHQIISEVLIRSLHQLVVRETESDTAGQYRTGNVIITGADHQPPDVSIIPGEMRDLIKWLKQTENKLNPIERAALLHHKLVYIHPFFDGNGRTARLLMNVLLMQAGYPLVIILKNDRKKYYRALSQADKGKYQLLVQFIAQAVERSLNLYLQAVSPVRKSTEKYLLLSEIAKHTPYSEKYLNLLIRQGKLEAHKEKRNWVTSENAVKRYMENRQRHRKT
jgi:Fic family protein